MCLSTKPNCLEGLNLIGTPISYHINKRSKFFIPFGGFLTIFVILSVFSLVSVFVIPFVQRLDPRVVFQKLKKSHPDPWNLNSTGFFLGLKLDWPGVDPNEINKHFSIICTYSMTVVDEDGKKTSTKKRLNFEKITINEFGGDKFLFKMNNLENSYQVKFENDTIIEGSPVSTKFSYVKIQIYMINSTASNKFYKQLEEIDGGKITVLFTDHGLQLENYTSPSYEFHSIFADDISLSDEKNVIIESSILNVTSDTGYFLEKNIYSDLGLSHDTTNVMSRQRRGKELIIYDIDFRLSSFFPQYFRTYLKIPELLANIGGLVSIILKVFNNLNEYVTEFNFNVVVMDALFEFDEEFVNGLKVSNNADEIKKLKKGKGGDLEISSVIKGNNSAVSINESSHRRLNKAKYKPTGLKNDKNQNEAKEKEEANNGNDQSMKIVSKANRRIDPFFHGWDACFFLFCCICRSNSYSRKKMLYEKGRAVSEYYLDFIHIIKKSMEFDILKFLILNKEQNILFNLMKRPMITLSTKENPNDSRFEDRYEDYIDSYPILKNDLINLNKNQKMHLLDTYNKVFSKSNKKSIIDRKLIESIGENFELLNL